MTQLQSLAVSFKEERHTKLELLVYYRFLAQIHYSLVQSLISTQLNVKFSLHQCTRVHFIQITVQAFNT